MKKLILLFTLIGASLFSFGQKAHSECVAAFLGQNMIVNEYSPRGVAKLNKTAIGDLSVNLVELGESTLKKESTSFMLALQDQETQTLTMLTKKPIHSISAAKLLAKTKVGDKIVILMVDERFALPHNSIEIVE